jgi:hypothetical protein
MITRQDQIEQSAFDFVKAGLEALNYSSTIVEVREAFPTPDERSTELTKTRVSMGFNFDNGGQNIELGSNLTQRLHTIEIWVFGVAAGVGRNVANVIRTLFEDNNYLLPLKDIGNSGDVIDHLVIPEYRSLIVQRQVNPDPSPWDHFVWTCTLQVEDIFYPALVN